MEDNTESTQNSKTEDNIDSSHDASSDDDEIIKTNIDASLNISSDDDDDSDEVIKTKVTTETSPRNISSADEEDSNGVIKTKVNEKVSTPSISSDDDDDSDAVNKKKQKRDTEASPRSTSDDDGEDSDVANKKGDDAENSPKNISKDDNVDNEEAAPGSPHLAEISSSSSDDSSVDEGPRAPSLVYDFDLMMAKKKEENGNRRKKRNFDIINDNDDIIADIINQMKTAVDSDFNANTEGKTAISKLKLLPFVVRQLRKLDLRDAFLDAGVLSVLTDWLTPLADRSLPHLNIRENILKLLLDFNICDTDKIKASGIGKAVMYLSKHPKEIKENKKIARQLISDWARPIFQLDLSYDSLSREEREERDLALVKGRPSTSSSSGAIEQGKELRPGDKGYIPRARVPAPSTKDYLIRPKSTIDTEIKRARPSRQDPRIRELSKRARR